jgi:hypothetical protein
MISSYLDLENHEMEFMFFIRSTLQVEFWDRLNCCFILFSHALIVRSMKQSQFAPTDEINAEVHSDNRQQHMKNEALTHA